MPVNTKRKDYEDMAPVWCRLRDVIDGRDAVIKSGVKYVPDLPGGDVALNDAYRKRGNFFNATKRTVQGMVGGIFQEAPQVEFPVSIKDYLDDLTLTNIDFESFATGTGRELMSVARYGVMIDMPAQMPASAPAGTQPRPYCIGYKTEDIINWRTERRGGDDILVMVVLKEHVEEPDEKDAYSLKCVEQYRVLELKGNVCIVQVWQEKESAGKKSWVQVGDDIIPTRRGIALNFIPFVFLGATHCTPDLELPPLTDLADVNLAHWRNSVDYEWGLHLVALPTPWVAGAKGAAVGPMKIGPSVVWELDLKGTAGMLEFSGTGLGAIKVAMGDKEKQMAVLGARLLEPQAMVQETAAAVTMRHSDEHANLRTVAQSIETGLTLVLQVVAWWAGTDATPLETPVNVELNKDYLNVKASPQEIQVALTALQAGEISFKTWWNLLTTGGWGREGIDAAEERKEINSQKALAPEPALDPALSPPDPAEGAPAPKTKTVTGADGKVKYTITES